MKVKIFNKGNTKNSGRTSLPKVNLNSKSGLICLNKAAAELLKVDKGGVLSSLRMKKISNRGSSLKAIARTHSRSVERMIQATCQRIVVTWSGIFFSRAKSMVTAVLR